jgi:hypothetical protein
VYNQPTAQVLKVAKIRDNGEVIERAREGWVPERSFVFHRYNTVSDVELIQVSEKSQLHLSKQPKQETVLRQRGTAKQAAQ